MDEKDLMIVNSIDADGLPTQGARAPAAIILI